MNEYHRYTMPSGNWIKAGVDVKWTDKYEEALLGSWNNTVNLITGEPPLPTPPKFATTEEADTWMEHNYPHA